MLPRPGRPSRPRVKEPEENGACERRESGAETALCFYRTSPGLGWRGVHEMESQQHAHVKTSLRTDGKMSA